MIHITSKSKRILTVLKYTVFLSCFFTLTAFEAFAGTGPTSIGAVEIGMSKSEYISATGIKPIDCNNFRDRKGKPKRSELKYLNAEKKTLCWGFASEFDKTGSLENIQVNGVSYDVIETDTDSSKFLEPIGHSSKAIFLKDRLIGLTITFPRVGLETLTAKYGEPKIVDKRKIEICKNRMGNEFKNNVGELDAAWTKGDIEAKFRAEENPPRETCTDGITMQYYIIEEPKQLKIIEDAITAYREKISKEAVKDSPF